MEWTSVQMQYLPLPRSEFLTYFQTILDYLTCPLFFFSLLFLAGKCSKCWNSSRWEMQGRTTQLLHLSPRHSIFAWVHDCHYSGTLKVSCNSIIIYYDETAVFSIYHFFFLTSHALNNSSMPCWEVQAKYYYVQEIIIFFHTVTYFEYQYDLRTIFISKLNMFTQLYL